MPVPRLPTRLSRPRKKKPRGRQLPAPLRSPTRIPNSRQPRGGYCGRGNPRALYPCKVIGRFDVESTEFFGSATHNLPVSVGCGTPRATREASSAKSSDCGGNLLLSAIGQIVYHLLKPVASIAEVAELIVAGTSRRQDDSVARIRLLPTPVQRLGHRFGRHGLEAA